MAATIALMSFFLGAVYQSKIDDTGKLYEVAKEFGEAKGGMDGVLAAGKQPSEAMVRRSQKATDALDRQSRSALVLSFTPIIIGVFGLLMLAVWGVFELVIWWKKPDPSETSAAKS